MSTDIPRLTKQELEVARRLIGAYPEHVPSDRVTEYVCYSPKGDVGDSLSTVSTQVCRIRSLLGREAIDTVYRTRVRADGAVVADRRSPMLGYRAGASLMGLVQYFIGTVSPGSSETHPMSSVTSPTTSTVESHARSTWQAREPHRNLGHRVQAQLEASCLQAVGL